MAVNYNYYLSKKVEELQLEELVPEDLYSFVADERLKYIFSVFHKKINELIKFMYSKYDRCNYHFNADESRELSYYIKEYEDIKYMLKNTDNAFVLDDNYVNFLNYCKTFLVGSGGSPIPNPLNKIRLKEYEPIFSFSSHVVVTNIKEKKKCQKKIIGEGSYAKVYKFYDEFYDQLVIVKKANKNLNDKEIERFKKEYEIMKSFNSPYTLKVYNYNNKNNEYYAEYADSTIYDYIQKNNQKLTLNERYNLIIQILHGFKYVHSRELLHRDISYTNILVKKYDDVVRIKISDFGLVKEKDSNLTSLESEIKGSLNDKSNLSVVGFAKYNILHETFALTRLILFILTGKSNLDKVDNEEIRKFVLKGTSGVIEDRYKNIEEIKSAFIKLYKKLCR